VYGSDGGYLGEIRSAKRLITNTNKKGRRKYVFTPRRRGAIGRYADYAGYACMQVMRTSPTPEVFD
jgi:hypothetical protein